MYVHTINYENNRNIDGNKKMYYQKKTNFNDALASRNIVYIFTVAKN